MCMTAVSVRRARAALNGTSPCRKGFLTTTENQMAEEPIHETSTEARAGDGNPVNRYILYISLTLVVVLLIVVLAGGWLATSS